jgi:hypothetical protein
VVHFRVFALSHDHDEVITAAAEEALGGLTDISKTNI